LQNLWLTFLAFIRFGDDKKNSVFASTRPIARFGLALEPWAGLARWASAEQLDALFYIDLAAPADQPQQPMSAW